MSLALSLGRLKSVFPILEEYVLPLPPAYRLSSDLRGMLSALDVALW